MYAIKLLSVSTPCDVTMYHFIDTFCGFILIYTDGNVFIRYWVWFESVSVIPVKLIMYNILLYYTYMIERETQARMDNIFLI